MVSFANFLENLVFWRFLATCWQFWEILGALEIGVWFLFVGETSFHALIYSEF